MTRMAHQINILDLPDLALYNICTYITDPFDLVHFGNTCQRLRSVSSLPSLWWPVILKWFDGIWIFVDKNNYHDHPRTWLIHLFKKISMKIANTETQCVFADGEIWKRSDSSKFRCILGWLQIVHPNRKIDSPAILYDKWLYDVGLFRRMNVQTDFTAEDFQFSENHINVLANLGQAQERDLRTRKQPNKDKKYYIKRVATADTNWKSDLFPPGLTCTTCPFLMCPFQDSLTDERSGLQGLSISMSIILVKLLKIKNEFLHLHARKLLTFIQTFCAMFQQEVMHSLPDISYPYKPRVLSLINQQSFNTEFMEALISAYNLNISCRDVITEFTNFVSQYQGIDFMVDKVRSRLRESLYDEINHVLFHDSDNYKITRINITDSDMIGGDNSKQEMSAAAFVSSQGVLVSWHLTGRMRF